MRTFKQWVGEFVRRRDGLTTIGYAVMVALILMGGFHSLTFLTGR